MDAKEELTHTFHKVRQQTNTLCKPLAIEDYVIQSIEDVSPPKWHLAHSSWFFETFILKPFLPQYSVFDPDYHHLFNSYYQGLGTPFPRLHRGLLSRPRVDEIYAYREHIDKHMQQLLQNSPNSELIALTILGLHHEQQHQELLLMDIKHNFFLHPMFPTYAEKSPTAFTNKALPLWFFTQPGGLREIGNQGEEFCFDNERPLHRTFLYPYSIASRLVSNGEYLAFIEAQGYTQPQWWLADGWDCVQKNNWQAPLYWKKLNKEWHIFTLHGLQPLQLNEPVSHVSYYEAEAFARWSDARLPTEAEWEDFVNSQSLTLESANLLETGLYHPQIATNPNLKKPQQFFGDVWEWTSSPYMPYPGFLPEAGALGEYNGKFMANQMVLKGGSCATAKNHIRASYRNFFQPDKRWMFSGFRLAKSRL